jgi:hypothetical protein
MPRNDFVFGAEIASVSISRLRMNEPAIGLKVNKQYWEIKIA